jgi:hypothetical protein
MHYADHKERTTVGIGAFLRPENVAEIIDTEPNQEQAKPAKQQVHGGR